MTYRTACLRAALFAGAAMIALPAAAQTAPAPAPDAQPAVTEGDDVVVVARRREERLLDVPIAVSALSQTDLARLQAIDLSGIQGAIPNVNLVQGRG